jgi:multiple antibiotic resistance protein
MLDHIQIGKAFLILFAVIDIVGGIPLILQVRQKTGKIYPLRAMLVSLGIMVVFLFVGVDVRSFAVAGSLVLFFIALEMILGVRLFKEDTSAPGLPNDDPKVYSVVPLAFPVIAGAGTITTILSLRAEFETLNILAAIVLNMIPVLLVLMLTGRIERLLGRVGLIVMRKAFGIICSRSASSCSRGTSRTCFRDQIEPQRRNGRDGIQMNENAIAQLIVEAAFKVHRTLGPGPLENAYVHCMIHELKKMGLCVHHQHPLPLIYVDVKLDAGYRLDIWVEQKVIVEVKTVDEPHPIHTAQLTTYLRLTDNRLGLLINFNETLLKNGIRRIANGMVA